jgi:hypothetical protein
MLTVILVGQRISALAYIAMILRVARIPVSATLAWFHALMGSLVSEIQPTAGWLLPLALLVPQSVAKMVAVSVADSIVQLQCRALWVLFAQMAVARMLNRCVHPFMIALLLTRTVVRMVLVVLPLLIAQVVSLALLVGCFVQLDTVS